MKSQFSCGWLMRHRECHITVAVNNNTQLEHYSFISQLLSQGQVLVSVQQQLQSICGTRRVVSLHYNVYALVTPPSFLHSPLVVRPLSSVPCRRLGLRVWRKYFNSTVAQQHRSRSQCRAFVSPKSHIHRETG